VNLIGHENIVNIFDMNLAPPNRYYLVMEYLEGKPLNALLTRPVPADIAIPILIQVCDALAAAHKAGVVHRDLKPENIFLVKRGKIENVVKVLDFGLAKLLDKERPGHQTAAGLIVGTPEFMSPEQANSSPVDGRADIYSLGCIAWLLATARLPFAVRGFADLIVAHLQTMPTAPHLVNPAVPKKLSDVIMKAMQKAPQDRFQDAADFALALEGALKPDSKPAVAAVRHTPPPIPKSDSAIRVGLPPQPRHSASFDAVVTKLDGTRVGKLACRDISKGGMFLCCETEMPPTFTKVKVSITHAGLELLAEVVRHVPKDQAAAWGIKPGFGVQFVDLTPELREGVMRVVQGLPVDADKGTKQAADDAQAETVLSRYRARVNGDHYEMVGVRPDFDFPEIRQRAHEAQRELEGLKARPLSTAQKAQLDAALARIKVALDVIALPGPRTEYDAARGNYKGVARSIAAGLSVLELEKMRQAFLATRTGAAGSAHVKFLASRAYESARELAKAISACESALELDPLNLSYQQRYAGLLKSMREGPKV
jgi:serine/threonine-protein kinase